MNRSHMVAAQCALVLLVIGTTGWGQQPLSQPDISLPKAVLLNSYTRSTSEEKSLFFDQLFAETARTPGAKAYVIIYCGKSCAYGEIEAHIRGMRVMKVLFRKFPSEQFLVIHGGFREVLTTELWVVPPGACPPMPSPTVEIDAVKFTGTQKDRMVPYDCC